MAANVVALLTIGVWTRSKSRLLWIAAAWTILGAAAALILDPQLEKAPLLALVLGFGLKALANTGLLFLGRGIGLILDRRERKST